MHLTYQKKNLTHIKDIPFSDQDHLVTKLDISWNNLTTLEGIGRYPNLVILQCMGSGLTSLRGLEECPKIRKIAAMGNNLQDLSGLSNAHHLTHLHVDNNPSLESLLGVEGCTSLETLDCYNCGIRSLHGLEACSKLKHLSCHSNYIVDYTSLQRVPEKFIFAL